MPQQLGYVTLIAPQPQTTPGQDTVLNFTQQCDQVTVQNNTSNIVWISFDGATANGAKLLQPGVMIIESKFCSSVYLNSPVAANINGTTLPNITVLGEA